ncbi:MAG: hypothetical protein IKG76_07345, partial [Firmicutes bacterium]|nr:hypothetical protein [Bacillota bacterium]
GAPEVPDTKSYKYQADVTIENTPEMDGYTFSGWNRKDFKMPDNDVTIAGSWRVKDTLSYTVRYLEYGTDNPVADAKVIDNQVFDTFVTESAIKVTGYLLRENEDDPKSIQIKDGENVITFLYDAIRSYVVNYLDASTQKPVADPKTGPDQRVSTVVTESAIKVNGYLLKSNETQTLTIVKEASKNVITFLYDKETTPDTPTRPDRPVTPDPDPTDDPEPIDDPDTPLAPPTDDETEIDDGDTPLAPGTIDEDTEIDDEETPLSPFTGDNRHTGLWAGISIASLAGIALLSKRRRKPAKH